MAARVLVVYCHPNPKSFTHAVLEAVLAGLRKADAEVRVIDLHAERFDPVLVVDEEHRRRDLDQVEATRPHRELVAWCEQMIFVYPVWWGGFPAMLKGWIDRVFVSGLTYTFRDRPRTAVLPTGLMRGKDACFFYTLDTPALLSFLDPGWLAIYASVFKYCGFRRVRRHYLPRLKLTEQREREAWLRTVELRAEQLAARGSSSPARSRAST